MTIYLLQDDEVTTRKYVFGDTILQRSFFHRSHMTFFYAHVFFVKKLFIMIHKNKCCHKI